MDESKNTKFHTDCGSMHSTCKVSSQTKFQVSPDWGKSGRFLPITMKIFAIDILKNRI